MARNRSLPVKSRTGFLSHRECMEEEYEYANELVKKNPRPVYTKIHYNSRVMLLNIPTPTQIFRILRMYISHDLGMSTSVIRRKSSFRRTRRFVGSLASRAVSRARARAASVGQHWLAGQARGKICACAFLVIAKRISVRQLLSG